MQLCVVLWRLRAACLAFARESDRDKGNRMSSTHPTVLIVSSDARFAAAVIERWQRAVVCPSNSGACSADFVSMAADVSSGDAISAYNVAIIGPLTAERLPPLLERFGRTERPGCRVVIRQGQALPSHVENSSPLRMPGPLDQDRNEKLRARTEAVPSKLSPTIGSPLQKENLSAI